jgi:hypothetical protein
VRAPRWVAMRVATATPLVSANWMRPSPV